MQAVGDTLEVQLEIYRSRNRERVILMRDAYWQLSEPSFSKDVDQA